MNQTQHLQEHLQHSPYADMPVTDGWPVLAKVEIETLAPHAPHAPVREQRLVQVLDYYREDAC